MNIAQTFRLLGINIHLAMQKRVASIMQLSKKLRELPIQLRNFNTEMKNAIAWLMTEHEIRENGKVYYQYGCVLHKRIVHLLSTY